jgi:hypothetical protein
MDAIETRSRRDGTQQYENWSMGLLLLVTFLTRAVNADQPIVENYVGRQVPTAMVARNLERGSGLLRPQLDTAPFPNYFVVEPPLFELAVVVARRSTGLSLEAAGRIFSALMTVLAAWGLFDLVVRRHGPRAALLALFAFALFPLTIRYGRAFQPDASMLGAVVAGLACWDRYRAHGRSRWLLAGWCLLSLGFAVKIIAALLLVPLFLTIVRRARRPEVIVAGSTLLPALVWYAWANHLLLAGAGSRAAVDNQAIWLGLLGSPVIFNPDTVRFVGWTLLVRAFTPLGAGLALFGFWLHRRVSADDRRLWSIWGISVLAVMALLGRKLHHEYYWLPLAPVVAVGIGCALDEIARKRTSVAVTLAALLLGTSALQVHATWQTPTEWDGLLAAAKAVSAAIPQEALIAAPEALLFQTDHRGCRMEWTGPAAQRAAREWALEPDVKSPLELIEYYRSQGACYFVDLGSRHTDSERKGLHDAVRRRYKVIVDRPDVIIAELVDSEIRWNAN